MRWEILQRLHEVVREELLPHTAGTPMLTVDLKGLLHTYQRRYPGAMYSGCGGGYLLVVSAQPVPGRSRSGSGG